MQEIIISGRKIGIGHDPFVIAEMSGNHNQSLARALALVDAAAKAGVDALKIQTYTADTMTLNLNKNEFVISNRDSLWYGNSLYELYQKAHTPWDWHQAIFERCKEHGILGFSTPFDESAVDFLESLNVPFYKIASFENTDLPLVRKVAATKKPLIISTGMATAAELDETVCVARQAGCRDLILLKCTSTYPASANNSNLLTIPHMRDLFNCQVGLSDHTLGIGVAIASVALGATVIEKHFTLCRSDGGVDAEFSLEPADLQALVIGARQAAQALGKVNYGPITAEKASLKFRRSLYVTKDIQPGDVLQTDNIKVIRPGLGLSPKYYDFVLGKKVNKFVEKGTPVTWELID